MIGSGSACLCFLGLIKILKKSGKLPEKICSVCQPLSQGSTLWPSLVAQLCGLSDKGVGGGVKKQQDQLRHDTMCCGWSLTSQLDRDVGSKYCAVLCCAVLEMPLVWALTFLQCLDLLLCEAGPVPLQLPLEL